MPDEIEKPNSSAKRSIPYKLSFRLTGTTSLYHRLPKSGLWRSAETLLQEWLFWNSQSKGLLFKDPRAPCDAWPD